MAIFVKLPTGEKIFLDRDDPRRALLEPCILDCIRDYLRTFRDWNLSWSLDKSDFALTEIVTLGLSTDRVNVTSDPASFQSLADIEPPMLGMTESSTSKQLQSVLGMLGYIAQCIGSQEDLLEYRRLHRVANRPMEQSESRLSASNYGPEQRDAVIQMRDLLMRNRMKQRVLINPSAPAIFMTDASGVGWSAGLWQYNELGRLAPIRLAAGVWNDEMGVSKVGHLEACAAVNGARAFDDTIPQLSDILWRNDHRNLRWWAESTDPAMRRWLSELTHHLNLYMVCGES